MNELKEIERSIIKKYRKDIYSKFIKACKDYNLVNDKDHIMVCISGGKDSFLLAKCLEELQKHSKIKFKLSYVCMNPGYKEEVVESIMNNAKKLNINLDMFKTNIFDVAMQCDKGICYLCARMRRGHLYNYAKKLGCNKIALGHHFDDVIETTLLSMFYGSEVKTMLPKLKSQNFLGLELIRPLYYVKEEAIISFKKYNNLEFINCSCIMTDENTNLDSKRLEIKNIIKLLKEKNKSIPDHIFKSIDNINLDCCLGYKKDGIYKSFLDNFKNN